MNSYPNLTDRFSNATEINLTIDKCNLQERIKRVCALAAGSARNIKYKEACFYVSSLRMMAQEKFISPTYPGSSYSFPHDEKKKDRKMNATFFSDCTISKKEKCKEGGRSVSISFRRWPRKPSCKYFRLETPQERCLCKLSMNELRLNGLHWKLF